MGSRLVPTTMINVTVLAPASGAVPAAAMDLVWARSVGRKAIIRKVMAYNNTGANSRLIFGTCAGDVAAAAFTYRLPDINVLNGLLTTVTEDELPGYEFTNNIYVGLLPVVAPALTQVRLEVEIEEY